MEVLRTVWQSSESLGACGGPRRGVWIPGRSHEETHWIGGQLTNQSVPPDEHRIDVGATASYRALRKALPILPYPSSAHVGGAGVETSQPG